jgi:archaetidylinositol phosphate synthase
MLSQRKSLIEKHLDPIAKLLHGVNPNILTLLGSIPSLLFFVFLILHWYIAALVMLPGSAFDMLDGMVARKYHNVTAFGGFLDSFMDRISDFFIITSFAFSGIVRWEITAPLFLFAYLTSYARSRGELANTSVSFAVGLIERTERLILIFIALLFYMLVPKLTINGFNTAEIVFLLIAALSFITVVQRIIYAYKKL